MTSPEDWIREHRIAAFFLLTYAITWTIDFAVLASGMEPSWTRWIFSGFLSALGPVFAAAVVLRVSGDSLREWALQVVRWRVHPKWYVAAIGIPAVIALGSGVVGAYFGSPVDFGNFSPDLVTLGIGVLLATFLGGGQEELGWRGFAQPELQARYGAFRAAVVIGVLWGGWHLPLFVDPTAPHAQWPLAAQAAYFVGITGFSVLLAWIYNGTGGSVLLAMLMHGADNAMGGLVPVDLDIALVDGTLDWALLAPMNVSHALITWLLALVVLGVAGTGLLARRRGSVPFISAPARPTMED